MVNWLGGSENYMSQNLQIRSHQLPHSFQCWNTQCPNYAGSGIQLEQRDVFEDSNGKQRCRICGSEAKLALPSSTASTNFAGLALGVAIGASVGGAVGAVFGGLIGILLADKTGSR